MQKIPNVPKVINFQIRNDSLLSKSHNCGREHYFDLKLTFTTSPHLPLKNRVGDFLVRTSFKSYCSFCKIFAQKS